MKSRVLWGMVVCFFCFSTQVYGDSSFDRELVIKNQGRADKVETVLRELLKAYENEDAQEFLDYVSEDRFRQDYLTFTDALYSDFRTYEIFRVDYWVDRVVPDNIKQFLYVRWEKRYETLDDAQQLTQRGYSRFLFDEVNGEYLLIELAGNDLFGASLAEWTGETPAIPGQETAPVGSSKADLVIQSVQAVGVSSLSVVIANTGQAASQSTTALIAYGAGFGSGPLTQNIDAINPGGSFNFFIPYDVVYGVDLITIDPANIVPESNEANNIGGPY